MADVFDARHYVPILRWKEAERSALSQIGDSEANFLTPLIELVPDNFLRRTKKGTERLRNTFVANRVAGQLFQSWGRRPFFADLHNLPTEILSHEPEHPLVLLGQYGRNLGLGLIPVVGIGNSGDHNNAVVAVLGMFGHGACIRLTVEDTNRPDFDRSLHDVLSLLKLGPEKIDLLVDFQIIEGSAQALDTILGSIPNLHEWRNLIVASGAFPKDLSKLAKNQKHVLERSDWLGWRSQVASGVPVARLPNFSDYTIQHAKYSRMPGYLRYSASIRYTTDESWIIMRGEDVFNPSGPGFKQYPDWAILLCNLPDYCGEAYSSGDKYIKDMSLQSAVTGDAASWLAAGINHHMTVAVQQLAKLFGTSTGA